MNTKVNPILKIDRLKCIYDSNPVLICDNLNFYPSDIYFIIGKSGIGKSTFLEAIGLMTNTISADSKVEFDFYPENLKNIWSDRSHDISAFRKQYFSFIFQNTNLMSNFSAGENMCFGKMISGASFSEAKDEVHELMKIMELEADYFDKNIANLSGGQRQRLAFIRGFSTKYNVMFCDEPTGNLDPILSEKLMTHLQSAVASSNKTALIVSHNIDLAIKFANKILIIEPKNQPHFHGYLNANNIIEKSNNSWRSSTSEIIASPKDYILKKMA